MSDGNVLLGMRVRANAMYDKLSDMKIVDDTVCQSPRSGHCFTLAKLVNFLHFTQSNGTRQADRNGLRSFDMVLGPSSSVASKHHPGRATMPADADLSTNQTQPRFVRPLLCITTYDVRRIRPAEARKGRGENALLCWLAVPASLKLTINSAARFVACAQHRLQPACKSREDYPPSGRVSSGRAENTATRSDRLIYTRT